MFLLQLAQRILLLLKQPECISMSECLMSYQLMLHSFLERTHAKHEILGLPGNPWNTQHYTADLLFSGLFFCSLSSAAVSNSTSSSLVKKRFEILNCKQFQNSKPRSRLIFPGGPSLSSLLLGACPEVKIYSAMVQGDLFL